jgi:hypothetical protein
MYQWKCDKCGKVVEQNITTGCYPEQPCSIADRTTGKLIAYACLDCFDKYNILVKAELDKANKAISDQFFGKNKVRR